MNNNGYFVIDHCKVENLGEDYSSGTNFASRVSFLALPTAAPPGSFIGSCTVKNCDIKQPNPSPSVSSAVDIAIACNCFNPGNRAANVIFINNTINTKGIGIGNIFNYKTNSNVTSTSLIRNNHIVINGSVSNATAIYAVPKGILIYDSKYTTVSGNLIEGISNYGMQIYSDPSPNFSSDNSFFGNDLSALTSKVAQVYIDINSQTNYFGPWTNPNTGQTYPSNVFGPVLANGLGVYVDSGTNNICQHNDFSLCNSLGTIPGWGIGTIGCILLSGNSHASQIIEHPKLGTKYFPTGTSLCNQVLIIPEKNVATYNYRFGDYSQIVTYPPTGATYIHSSDVYPSPTTLVTFNYNIDANYTPPCYTPPCDMMTSNYFVHGVYPAITRGAQVTIPPALVTYLNAIKPGTWYSVAKINIDLVETPTRFNPLPPLPPMPQWLANLNLPNTTGANAPVYPKNIIINQWENFCANPQNRNIADIQARWAAHQQWMQDQLENPPPDITWPEYWNPEE